MIIKNYIFRTNTEDPWDGSILNHRRFNQFVFVTVLTFLLCGLPLAVSAGDQSKLYQSRSNLSVKSHSDAKMDKDKIAIAEDYRDILEQLEKIAHDYQKYFSEIDNSYAKKYQAALIKIVINLNDEVYNLNVNRLLKDIVKLKESLLKQEAVVKNDTDQKKFYRNVKSLRIQLELLEEFIKTDIYDRVEENEEYAEAIKMYITAKKNQNELSKKYIEEIIINNRDVWEQLKLQKEEIQTLLNENYHLVISREKLKELEDKIEDEILSELEIIDPVPPTLLYVPRNIDPKTIDTIFVHNMPVPPRQPLTPDSPNLDQIYIIDGTTHAGMARSFVDTISVPNTSTPIYINNQIGDLNVIGWKDSRVKVVFDIKVMAEDSKMAGEFLEEIEIKLQTNPKGVYLSSRFPEINDTKRKIIGSLMKVYVPINNDIICKSSFGKVKVQQLAKKLEINGSHCLINIDNIVGSIKGINKSGKTQVSHSSGEINLKSSLGPVLLQNCSGELEIENKFAIVEMNNCVGEIIIRNSGDIKLTKNQGSVDIDNKNGIVKVDYHEGFLSATNSFKPVIVSKITGNVELKNNNAQIVAEKISGSLTASNKYGKITALELNGPINMYNKSGEVTLFIDDYIEGKSEIISEYGKVDLRFGESSDLFLTAMTEGGSIVSSFDNKIIKDSHSSSTKLTLGNGSNPLKVNGTNVVITINKTR